MIIGITGLLGAGKDTAAEILVRKGFEHHSLSDEIRRELKKEKLEATRENLQSTGTRLREKFGLNELAKRALSRCQSQKSVLTSLRNIGEVDWLKKNADFQLWEIWAPTKVRYQRLMRRGRKSEKNTASFEKFIEQEKKELKGSGARQNLMGVISLADVKIQNDQNVKILERRINDALKKISAPGLG